MRTKSVSDSSWPSWSRFSEISISTQIALGAIASGVVVYAAAKSLQGRGVSLHCLGSYPVLKILGAVAGLAILGGFYCLGSGESSRAKKKTVKDCLEEFAFKKEMPEWAVQILESLKVPCKNISSGTIPGLYAECRKSRESVFFFQEIRGAKDVFFGMCLRLGYDKRVNSSSEPINWGDVLVMIARSETITPGHWSFSFEPGTELAGIQCLTVWNFKDTPSSGEAKRLGSYATWQNPLLYECLSGNDFSWELGEGEREGGASRKRHWTLYLAKPK